MTPPRTTRVVWDENRENRAMREFLDSTGYVDENGDPIVFDELPTGVGEHDDDDMETGPRRDYEPRLYGAKEAAAALGVQQTNLRVVAGLPEPYDTIGATTLWRADEIDLFADRRRNRRGR